jgi:hypothetical protein
MPQNLDPTTNPELVENVRKKLIDKLTLAK